MSNTDLRIPRVMALALLLVGVACADSSDDGAGSSKGVNASSARIRTLAEGTCEQEQQCEPDDFAKSYDNLNDCTEQRVDDFPLSGQSGEEVRSCQDALLDLTACYTAHWSCEAKNQESREKCSELYETFEELCQDFEDDDDDDDDEAELAEASLSRRIGAPASQRSRAAR